MNARWIRALAAGAAAASGVALVVPPPRLRRWGATGDEVRQPLPGDDLIGHPKYEATRAITICERAVEIWPWLVQMGQGRGGAYSYDWLENLAGLDIHSADRIIPEFQRLAVADIVRIGPETGMAVAVIKPERALVLRSVADVHTRRPWGPDDPYYFDWTWTFILYEVSEGATRLIVRIRADFT